MIPPKFLFLIAGLFALTALAVWAVFLRPAPIRTALGKISGKTYKPAGTYWQYPAGLDRGFRTATPIPISEAYVFEIVLPEYGGPVFYSLNTGAARNFDIGQTVQLTFRERLIPFAGKRFYVMNMERR
jgi:hypothetical protein